MQQPIGWLSCKVGETCIYQKCFIHYTLCCWAERRCSVGSPKKNLPGMLVLRVARGLLAAGHCWVVLQSSYIWMDLMSQWKCTHGFINRTRLWEKSGATSGVVGARICKESAMPHNDWITRSRGNHEKKNINNVNKIQICWCSLKPRSWELATVSGFCTNPSFCYCCSNSDLNRGTEMDVARLPGTFCVIQSLAGNLGQRMQVLMWLVKPKEKPKVQKMLKYLMQK